MFSYSDGTMYSVLLYVNHLKIVHLNKDGASQAANAHVHKEHKNVQASKFSMKLNASADVQMSLNAKRHGDQVTWNVVVYVMKKNAKGNKYLTRIHAVVNVQINHLVNHVKLEKNSIQLTVFVNVKTLNQLMDVQEFKNGMKKNVNVNVQRICPRHNVLVVK